MRAMVISGGGAKGAFGAGIAEYLIRSCKHDYDLFLGTSTGSLIAPLLALNEIERLRTCFTTATVNSIFTISPFRIKKENGSYLMQMNHWGIIRQFLTKSKTFGNSKALRRMISENIRPLDFEKIRDCGTEVIITVSNLSRNRIEYKTARECQYDDLIDWIWASCNVVPFMSMLEKNGQQYADGGFGDLVPIQEAILRGATEIDAIILHPEKRLKNRLGSRNAFDSLLQVFDFMLDQISRDDVVIGNLHSNHSAVRINYYYTPRILTENSLVFDPELMTAWWEEGYRFASTKSPLCTTIPPESH